MSKKLISTFNKRTCIANFTILSLRSFNAICFEKLEQIIRLFNQNKLFFDFEVYEKDKEAVCTALRNLDKNSKLEVLLKKNIRHIAYESSVDYLLGVFKIIGSYALEESTFFEPINYSWEQYLLNGTLENEFKTYNVTNALFSVYSHDGYHHALFRTGEYDYKETLAKIKSILD